MASKKPTGSVLPPAAVSAAVGYGGPHANASAKASATGLSSSSPAWNQSTRSVAHLTAFYLVINLFILHFVIYCNIEKKNYLRIYSLFINP